jgi:hypothetical protein
MFIGKAVSRNVAEFLRGIDTLGGGQVAGQF